MIINVLAGFFMKHSVVYQPEGGKLTNVLVGFPVGIHRVKTGVTVICDLHVVGQHVVCEV